MEKPSVAFDPLPSGLPLHGKRVLAAHPPSCHPRRVFGCLESGKKMKDKERKREKTRLPGEAPPPPPPPPKKKKKKFHNGMNESYKVLGWYIKPYPIQNYQKLQIQTLLHGESRKKNKKQRKKSKSQKQLKQWQAHRKASIFATQEISQSCEIHNVCEIGNKITKFPFFFCSALHFFCSSNFCSDALVST